MAVAVIERQIDRSKALRVALWIGPPALSAFAVGRLLYREGGLIRTDLNGCDNRQYQQGDGCYYAHPFENWTASIDPPADFEWVTHVYETYSYACLSILQGWRKVKSHG